MGGTLTIPPLFQAIIFAFIFSAEILGEAVTIEGGYLDVGILDTMKDLLVNMIGAVIFSFIGYRALKISKTSKVAQSLMITPNEHDEADIEAKKAAKDAKKAAREEKKQSRRRGKKDPEGKQ